LINSKVNKTHTQTRIDAKTSFFPTCCCCGFFLIGLGDFCTTLRVPFWLILSIPFFWPLHRHLSLLDAHVVPRAISLFFPAHLPVYLLVVWPNKLSFAADLYLQPQVKKTAFSEVW
jgi:hypothetical protein